MKARINKSFNQRTCVLFKNKFLFFLNVTSCKPQQGETSGELRFLPLRFRLRNFAPLTCILNKIMPVKKTRRTLVEVSHGERTCFQVYALIRLFFHSEKALCTRVRRAFRSPFHRMTHAHCAKQISGRPCVTRSTLSLFVAARECFTRKE